MNSITASEDNSWYGVPISKLYNNKTNTPWSFAINSVVPSKYHHVLYEVPIDNTQVKPPQPYYKKKEKVHLWDDEHVRMPFSPANLYIIHEDEKEIIKERWTLICDALVQPIKTSKDFEEALKKYTKISNMQMFHYFFNEQLEAEDCDSFFNNVLPKIIQLALNLPELFPCGIPLLQKNYNRSLSMSQLQISCLLANAFLCTFPWNSTLAASYPGVNLSSLYSANERPNRQQCIFAKLKCIINYFYRVVNDVPLGVVTFERKMIPKSKMPRWDLLHDKYFKNTKIHVTCSGSIEDASGFLQIDFANKNIGGGVLRYGCVQEEIRFVICPELIVSRLFVERLGDSEAVIITGAERYNNFTGYSDDFRWKSDHIDPTPFDSYRRRQTTICVIDAIRFSHTNDQFQRGMILRELNKAYVGFHSHEKNNLAPVATGNWGCGAFQGNKQLKALIQLIACCISGRNLVYYSCGDELLAKKFYEIYLFLCNQQITIAQLWNILITCYKTEIEDLYEFIRKSQMQKQKQLTINNFFSNKAVNGNISKKSSEHEDDEKNKKNSEEIVQMEVSEEFPSTPSSVADAGRSGGCDSDSPPSLPSSSPVRSFYFKSEDKQTPKKTNPKDIKSKFPTKDIGDILDKYGE